MADQRLNSAHPDDKIQPELPPKAPGLVSFVDPSMTRAYSHVSKKKSGWLSTLLSPLKNPRLLLTVILLGSAVLGFIIVVTYVVYANSLATPESLINRKNSGLIFYDREGKEFYRSSGARDTTIIHLADIPDSLEQATVAIEDKDFYKHGGFSVQGIFRAIYYNVANKDLTAAGGSTITQQLVKNALLTQQKSFIRKLQEIILSIEISRRYSKDQILELYLTSTYYGSNAYGVREAADIYFQTPLEKLTVAQSSMIAGLPQAPSAYSPLDGDPELAKQRQRQVLDSMAKQGYLSQAQRTAAYDAPLKYSTSTASGRLTGQAPHFVEYIRSQLVQKYGEDTITRSGYKIYTTLDSSLQQYAQQTVARRVAALKGTGATNGALVALDPTSGQVLSMVGSADYDNDAIQGKVNVATSLRQPGSATKPFMYMTAFESGVGTPATILHDTPTDFNGYKPLDADRKFRGDVTVRRALSNSLNIPAVEMVQKVGADNFVDTLRSFGAGSMSADAASRCGLSIVLGCAEVKLIDLAHAYATLADEGTYRDLVSYTKIMDKNGAQIYPERSFGLFNGSGSGGKQVIKSDYTFMISDILADNAARSEIFGPNSQLKLSRTASVKTGTTDNSRDAWAFGYTPQVAVGVWVGDNANAAMTIAGATGAAPIWHEVMEYYLRGKPVETFKRPASVTQLPICFGQEAVAQVAGGSTFMEYFSKDHLPKKSCNVAPTPSPTPESSASATPTDVPTPTVTVVPTVSVTPKPSITSTLLPITTPTPSPTPTHKP